MDIIKYRKMGSRTGSSYMVQSARLLIFSESYCRNLGADCNMVSAQQRLLHLLTRRNESVNLAQKGEKRLLAQES